MHRYKYPYTESFFILCIEFHVTCIQTKFCRRCPRHVKGLVCVVQKYSSTHS